MLLFVTLIDVHVNTDFLIVDRCLVFICAANLIRVAFIRRTSQLTECEVDLKDFIDILIEIKSETKLVFDVTSLLLTLHGEFGGNEKLAAVNYQNQQIKLVSRTYFKKYRPYVTFIV